MPLASSQLGCSYDFVVCVCSQGAGPVAAPMASLGFQRFVGGPDVEEGSGGPPPSLSTHALVKVKVDSVGVVSRRDTE